MNPPPPDPANLQEDQIFQEALDLKDPGQRQAYLDQACARHPSLLARVQSLLRAYEQAGDFLAGESSPQPEPNRPSENLSNPPMLEASGTVVGRYKLLQIIGEGGFGVVYMAEQREPVKRRVALKIIKLGMDTRQVIGRFEAERQALAMMDHPNIAKVLDGGATSTGRPYFVMELVKGVSLLEFCDQNKLTLPERLQLFTQVCQAIHHAHQKGVIHRDIKPSNVLVALQDGQAIPKVIDFGVAKATQQELTEKTVFTRFHEFIGTPAYMSPEQAQFSGLDTDTRTDIYSLGVLLYELVTGRTPFDSEELLSGGYQAMQQIIREKDPPKPSSRLKNLSPEFQRATAGLRQSDPPRLLRRLEGDLDWIIIKAMEKDRTRRYESAAALALDIECFLGNQPITAAPPSLAYRFRKFAQRHRVTLTAGITVALALLLSSLTSVIMAYRAIQAERLTQHSLQEALDARQEMQQAQARANQEAAIADSVNRFLNEEFLGMADPMMEPNRDIKLSELLQRASLSLQSHFDGPPLVEASLRLTLGRVYRNQGNYHNAFQHAQRAVQLYSEQAETSPRDQFRARTLLASVLHMQGRDAETGRELESLFPASQQILGETDEVSIEIAYWLSENYLRTSRHDLANQLTTRLMTLAETHLAQDHWLRAAIITTRGRLYISRNETAEAAAFFQEWLDKNRSSFGEEHPYTLNLMHLLAYAHSWTGKAREAEDLYRRTIQIKERVLGREHPSCLSTMVLLGRHLYRQKRFEEAESILLNVFELYKKTLGTQHIATRGTIESIFGLYVGTKQPEKNKEFLRQVLRDDPYNTAALDALGQFLKAEHLQPLLAHSRDAPTTWRYSLEQPPADWFQPDFNDAAWPSGSGPFGNSTVTPVRTPWDGPSIWLRREFNLSQVPSGHLVLQALYDDSVFVYLNGRLVMQRQGWTGRGYRLAYCADPAHDLLQPGRNVLAIVCHNINREGLIDAGLLLDSPAGSLLPKSP